MPHKLAPHETFNFKILTRFISKKTVLGVVGIIAVSILAARYLQPSQSVQQKVLIDETWQLLDNGYIDASFNGLDWESVRKKYLSRTYRSEKAVYTAIREMLDELENPSNRFMEPTDFSNRQNDSSGQLIGVGIQIEQEEDTNRIVVVSSIDQSPAYRAGILYGDIIVAIDGQSTKRMRLNDAIDLIRGAVNSQVRLSIQRESEPSITEFELIREQIEFQPVRYSVDNTPEGIIGYIRLSQFNMDAAEKMSETIKELEALGVAAYILDLRSNPGGTIAADFNIFDMWISEGTTSLIVDRYGIRNEEIASDQALTDKPLIVLIDGGTSGITEILATALQDNNRATLVGTPTDGDGLKQSLHKLSNGSAVMFTMAKHLTPLGEDINQVGIQPDFTVELTNAQQIALLTDRDKVGTLEDSQYSKALEILLDTIDKSQ